MSPARPARLTRLGTSIDSPAGSFDVLAIYRKVLDNDPDITMPLAAIYTLLEVLTKTNASTVSEFMDILKRGKAILIEAVPNSYSLQAGCDIFQRFVMRSLDSIENFEDTKAHLVANGQLFVQRARQARDKIAETGSLFIKDGSTLLIHSYSRVVLAVLTRAALKNRRFKVYITESRPNGSGLKSKRVLERHGIPCCMLLDVAVAYAMHSTDMVLVGAEGIVENGGLINQIGTLNVAQLARAANKPFYCLVESHKFVRIFPLTQYDLAQAEPVLQFSNPPSRSRAASAAMSPAPAHPSPKLGHQDHEYDNPHKNGSQDEMETEGTEAVSERPNDTPFPERPERITSSSADVANADVMGVTEIRNNPQLDLTPPNLITGLITDLGVLNPMSGVSEELIRLYGA